MQYPQLLDAHKGIIYLFLAWLFLKLILMIVQPKEIFNQFREKTKIVEMVLGTLILVSGGWLFVLSGNNDEMWLFVKVALAILGIPLAIIGFRRYSIAVVSAAYTLFLYVFWIAKFKGFV